MKKIKNILFLICFGVVLFSPFLVSAQDWDVTVGDDGWDVTIGDDGWDISAGSGGHYGLPDGSISGIVEGILYWILGIFSAVALIGFAVAGIWYLTAAGDDTQIERAKKAMLYSIIGVVVGLMGFVILQAVEAMLNARSSF